MASKPYHDKETLESLYYDEGLTQKQIAKNFGVAHQTISDWMHRHDINPGIEAGQFDRIERASHFWGSHGYENVAAWDPIDKQMRHVKVHRLIAVAKYGFGAVKGMDVHHKNRHRIDNRPSNIELMDSADHKREHIGSELDPRGRDENGYWTTSRN